MQCARRLYAGPGFWSRSATDFKRLAGIAARFEGVTGPTRVYTIVDFEKPEMVGQCKSMADSDVGGFSSSEFESIAATDGEPAHARFHGSLSREISTKAQVDRAGFAGWRTRDRSRSMFGDGYWDIDAYKYLALRVKSDGRKYFINVQTDSIVPTDLHQHRLYVRQPGEWETVLVGLDGFVRTNAGHRVNPQAEMFKQKVGSIGVSIMDNKTEPFDLRIQRIWATNWPEEASRSQLAQQSEGVPDGEVEDGKIRHTAPKPYKIFS